MAMDTQQKRSSRPCYLKTTCNDEGTLIQLYNQFVMMTRRFAALMIVLCLLPFSRLNAHAQQTGTSKFFSETGHYVKGDFLKYYEANPNAVYLYGYPITEEFVSRDGLTVQYFQRTRLEVRDGRVQQSPLGSATYISKETLNITSPSVCRVIAPNRPSVCFSFLEFYEDFGGVEQFGLPVSGFEYRENVLVQYFEKARFEWRPNKPEGQRVVVSDLGRIYFDKAGEDPGLLAAVRTDFTTRAQIQSIQVRAFVGNAVTLSSGTQTAYVIVQDQLLQPVSNAQCSADILWADGRVETRKMSTNAGGIAKLELTFDQQPHGKLVKIQAACAFNELQGKTTASFRIWY